MCLPACLIIQTGVRSTVSPRAARRRSGSRVAGSAGVAADALGCADMTNDSDHADRIAQHASSARSLTDMAEIVRRRQMKELELEIHFGV